MPDASRRAAARRCARFTALAAVVAAAAALGACTAPADHPALEKADLAPLVPVRRFVYRGAALRGYELSPDGSKLAWTGPFLMRSRLFVRDNKTGEVRRFRTGSTEFQWTPDGRRLLYVNDSSGKEDTHVYMIDLARSDAKPVDLTPHRGIKAGIHQLIAGDPDHILVFHNKRDSKLRDLYRIDLNTGRETLVAQNPGDAVAPVTAHDGRVRGWVKSRDVQPPGSRRAPLATRKPALVAAPGETFRVLGVSPDKSFVWALSNRGRDRVALVAAHPGLGWEKVVFEDPRVDVSRVVMSRVSRQPLIVEAHPGYPRQEILDAGLRADLAALLQAQGNEPFGLEIVSSDRTEQRLVILIYTSMQHRYYLADRTTRSFTLLAEGVDADLATSFSPMKPVTIHSRDGLQLSGYLTLPRGAPPERLPMVLLVHGGPWLRTNWADPFRSEDATYAQFLANRGYAVLAIDFRGSIGYGRRFLAAGIGEFAGRMQDDVLDAARWAIDSGLADPERIAIMGWSYGGYAALVGLTQTPETFACGVSLNGISDLASAIESFPPYWRVDLSMWHDYVGDPAVPEDREDMMRRSPLTHAHKLARPVLIVQGDNDVRVRVDQAERMVQALKEAGKPVRYLRIPGMGHSMGYWVHRFEVLRTTEAFLHRCLGGRASRFEAFDALTWAWTRIKRWAMME